MEEVIEAFRATYDDVWNELERHRVMSDDELLQHFDSRLEFRDARADWTPEQTALFCKLVWAMHRFGLDWWHSGNGARVRCGRKDPNSLRGVGVLAKIELQQAPRVHFRDRFQVGNIPSRKQFSLTEELVQQIEAGLNAGPDLPGNWRRPRPGLWPDQLDIGLPDDDEDDGEQEVAEQELLPLNTILYGPPGTGKTWATFRRCVEICDGEAPDDREELRARYQQLLNERRVEFVTFHQSYGYEEFVEGIRPIKESDAGDGIRLDVRPGVLRRIAERARRLPDSAGSRRIFKMTLPDPVFAECIDNGCALLDRGDDIDWSDTRFDSYGEVQEHLRREINPEATWKDKDLWATWRFRVEMRPGDIVVVANGLNRFRAVGVVAGCYEYQKREDGFHHRRAVAWHWHVRDRKGDPVAVFSNGPFSPHWISGIRPSNRAGLLRYLDGIDDLVLPQPYVLVIDEINRANISRVMGELITLLEEDKREGAENEVAVTLPFSGESLTLPANLYILGTMNTADRSIALLDTALRRRFEFEEISPEPELLQEARERTDVDLPAVLRAINGRLEYLVDRDHAIGHAWFMDARTRKDVDSVMRRRIIPLIAEYFYDDWSKVRAVLGGTDHFVERSALPMPPGLENEVGETRYRWSVRNRFADDAYVLLVNGANSPTGGA